MSRFYGSLTGSAKTTATRCGSVSSRVSAHVRGWDIGVRGSVYACRECGADRIKAYRTQGSNGSVLDDLLVFDFCSGGCKE